jgi:DNA polymerase-3 subunit alpha
MSYVRLEDDSGGIELIVFQRALDQGGSYLIPNQGIIVKGRVSVRDEKEPQLMVDTIRPLSDLSSLNPAAADSEPSHPSSLSPAGAPTPSQTLWLKLPSEQDPLFEHIRLLLTMFPGQGRMIIYCEKEKKRIGTHCVLHEALLTELCELCGEKNVVLK